MRKNKSNKKMNYWEKKEEELILMILNLQMNKLNLIRQKKINNNNFKLRNLKNKKLTIEVKPFQFQKKKKKLHNHRHKTFQIIFHQKTHHIHNQFHLHQY